MHFAIGNSNELKSFTEVADERFNRWITEQEEKGRKFTQEQLLWLTMIKDHISTSLSITTDDFDCAPFYEKGGLARIYKLFGEELDTVLNELNEPLVTKNPFFLKKTANNNYYSLKC